MAGTTADIRSSDQKGKTGTEQQAHPNDGFVVLHYLDSVPFFRPAYLRSCLYKEAVIAYLDNAKQRGFVACSIWCCPPAKDESYIFNAHPTWQKIPKVARLRSWYQDLLSSAVQRGAVHRYVRVWRGSLRTAWRWADTFRKSCCDVSNVDR